MTADGWGAPKMFDRLTGAELEKLISKGNPTLDGYVWAPKRPIQGAPNFKTGEYVVHAEVTDQPPNADGHFQFAVLRLHGTAVPF